MPKSKINYAQAKNQAHYLRKKDNEYLELSQAGFGSPNQSSVVHLNTTTQKLLFLLPLLAAALPRGAANEVSRNSFYGNSRASYNNPTGKFNVTSLDQGKMENFYSQSSPLPAQTFPITVIKEVKHDTSPPLKYLHTKQALAKAKAKKAKKKKKWKEKRKKLLLKQSSPKSDPVIQKETGSANKLIPLQGFAGIGNELPGYVLDAQVPDPNGAAGVSQYVQWVNNDFAIFDKSTGKLQHNVIPASTLWHGFGGLCEDNLAGDPVVLYDKFANRWVMTQLAASVNTAEMLTMQQCTAVSTSADALGPYHRYAFQFGLEDYTKLGIWPDGYYLGISEGDPNACVLDRASMLVGNTAIAQCTWIPVDGFTSNPLPSDFDGLQKTFMPMPNYFAVLNFTGNNMQFYSFQVNWNDPNTTKVMGPISVDVAPFNLVKCIVEGEPSDSCVSQPDPSTPLDSLAFYIMHRLAYRQLDNVTATIVVNHPVAATNETVAVRWYQFQIKQTQQISLVQQGSFQPDITSRWVGSMAMDRMGNIALGYSASGPTVFPSLRITGRLFDDPLGKMQTEQTIAEGTMSQNLTNRFGDYSSMTVDPVDDCVLWYTGQYMARLKKSNSVTAFRFFKPSDEIRNLDDENHPQSDPKYSWSTYVASIRFQNCGG